MDKIHHKMFVLNYSQEEDEQKDNDSYDDNKYLAMPDFLILTIAVIKTKNRMLQTKLHSNLSQ